MPALGQVLTSNRGADRRRRRSRRSRSGSATTAALSSASAFAGRRSFGSDLGELFSELSTSHLAGCEGGGGQDPDRSRLSYSDSHINHPLKSTALTGDKEANEEEEDETLDPARHSFSLALREYQNRQVRSEAVSSPERKPGRWRLRPDSFDLNGPQGVDAAVLSPQFLLGGAGGVKKTSAASSRSRSGVFPSPVTPTYRSGSRAMAYQKGWSSERVPLPANCSRRYMGGSALLPFNNGRTTTLPFKWEDAEKWICSPVAGDGSGMGRPLPPPFHRRPKSKSGPLGPPGGIGGPYSSASPMVPCFDSGRVGNFTAGSPFLAGVLVPDRGCCGSYSSVGSGAGSGGDGGRRSCSANAEPYLVRSTSIHGWLDAMIELSPSLPSSQGTVQDEKLDCCRESAIMVSPSVLRKDVATQMSPEGSTDSSPKESPFSLPSPSSQPIEELESHSSKTEVRDVQVDDRVTVTRWSKKHIARSSDKRSSSLIEWKKKTVEAKASAWEVAETTTKCISKFRREEANIKAWENLQTAKAEAAMRKLEMKLEKKRSSSMDRILNKLRSAQSKAQELRSAATASQTHEVARTTKKPSYFRRTGQISSLSGCFTCHAF